MNAISKTPKVHHEEFLKHANRPAREKLGYFLDLRSILRSGLLSKLLSVTDSLDINEDPSVAELRKQNDPVGRSRLEKVLKTRRTHCRDQIKSLRNKGEYINLELGSWAADFYISSAIRKLRDSIVDKEEWLGEWTGREKEYLLTILLRVEPLSSGPSYFTAKDMNVSPKVEQLLRLLAREHNPSLTGLIFVQQRAESAVLAHLISVHPSTKDLFRCGTYVGTSTNSQRKYTDVAELLDPRDQQHYLDDLREGRKNLIIATSVLEEGIDVSSCNLVICFNKPVNLKTFIQRRGRARKMQAKFVIMVNDNDAATNARDWESVEEQMKAEYMDELRELEEIEEPDDGKESYDVRLEIPSTGYVKNEFDQVAMVYDGSVLAGLKGPAIHHRSSLSLIILSSDYQKILLAIPCRFNADAASAPSSPRRTRCNASTTSAMSFPPTRTSTPNRSSQSRMAWQAFQPSWFYQPQYRITCAEPEAIWPGRPSGQRREMLLTRPV